MTASVNVTYFDTAMALIEIGSIRLLTDPVFDAAGSIFQYGPIKLEKTSDTMTTSQEIGRVDAVLLSHDQHGDNLDHAGRAFLDGAPLVLTTPLAATRLDGAPAKGLAPWELHVLRGSDGDEVRITAMPAQHGPDGTQDATGPVTGFLIESDALSAPIYVSGDTIPFSGTEEIARRHAPIGLALLHLGRVRLAPMGDAGLSLSAAEAAAYSTALQARHVVPLHFEGWRHFTEGRAEAQVVFDLEEIGPRVRWLTPGQPSTFDI